MIRLRESTPRQAHSQLRPWSVRARPSYTHDLLGTTSIARLLAEEHAPGPARGWQPAQAVARGRSLPAERDCLQDRPLIVHSSSSSL
jgi:hypothetical protein